MAIVYGEKMRAGTFLVCCSNCGVTVGELSSGEIPYLGKYLGETGQQILCFECEGEGSPDLTPLALLPDLWSSIVIDGEVVITDVCDDVGIGGLVVSCLSSKPHFNTQAENA